MSSKGQRSWHRCQRGLFQHQRTQVRIQSSDTIILILNKIYLQLTAVEKTKIKKKRPGNDPIKKSIFQYFSRTSTSTVQPEHPKKCFGVIQCDQIGRFLDFGQLCKACGNNSFAQISHILSQFL